MQIKEWLTVKRVQFILLFGIAALVAQGINFSPVLGANNQYFTLFQLFSPIAGGFLGAVAGAASILVAQLAGLLVYNKPFDALNILRLTPALFAAVYFAKRTSKFSLAVPALAILAFILHPVGGQAWLYSMFWLIPIAASLMPENLLMRSLGATFTAHAVGGVIWLYTLPTTPGFWMGLMPIVIYERFVFGAGIAVSYVVMNTVLNQLANRLPAGIVHIDLRYAFNPQPALEKRMK